MAKRRKLPPGSGRTPGEISHQQALTKGPAPGKPTKQKATYTPSSVYSGGTRSVSSSTAPRSSPQSRAQPVSARASGAPLLASSALSRLFGSTYLSPEKEVRAELRAVKAIKKIALPITGGKVPGVKVKELGTESAGTVKWDQPNRILLDTQTAKWLAGKPGYARQAGRQTVLHEFAHTRQPRLRGGERERVRNEGGASAFANLALRRKDVKPVAVTDPFYRKAMVRAIGRGKPWIFKGQFKPRIDSKPVRKFKGAGSRSPQPQRQSGRVFNPGGTVAALAGPTGKGTKRFSTMRLPKGGKGVITYKGRKTLMPYKVGILRKAERQGKLKQFAEPKITPQQKAKIRSAIKEGKATLRQSSLNRGFGPDEQIRFEQAAALAELQGLPGVTYAQIAQGESNLRPGVPNPDDATPSLWQMTPSVQSAATIAKWNRIAAKHPGGYTNPVVAAKQARVLAGGGTGVSNYFGTGFVTNANAHLPGGKRQAKQILAGAGGSKASYPLGAKGKIIGTPGVGTHTLGNWQSDNAVDIAAKTGTPVRSVEDAVVTKVAGSNYDPGDRMNGYQVTLKGASGNEYFYTHLSSSKVKPGQKIKAGGLLGGSGAANGVEHLHFGVAKGDPRQAWKGGTSGFPSQLPGPYAGSRTMVRQLFGAKVRGDKEPGHSEGGMHDPNEPDSYAQDIGSAGGSAAEGEPPYSQATVSKVVKNLREQGANIPKGFKLGQNWEGNVGGYDIEFLTAPHGTGPHIHLGAKFSGGAFSGGYVGGSATGGAVGGLPTGTAAAGPGRPGEQPPLTSLNYQSIGAGIAASAAMPEGYLSARGESGEAEAGARKGGVIQSILRRSRG